jgi:hypothetical protein
MSLYRSQFIQTQVIDPVFSNNQRCVFRLPALVCLKKSVALSDLSFTTNTGATMTTIGGISNIIKTISLRIGGTQVDFNNFVPITNTIENLRSTTSKALSVDRYTKKNALDYKEALIQAVVADTLVKDTRLVVSNFGSPSAGSPDGLVYLNELLKFFNANHNLDASPDLLPLYLFKNSNIELTIEWQTNALVVALPTGTTPVTITGVRSPTLLMDCLDSSSPIYGVLDGVTSNVKLTYDRWEVETLNYSPPPTNGISVLRERLNQVNGKFVKRLCMLTQPNIVKPGLGISTYSASLPDERINLVLNGQQVLDYRSEGDGEKVSHFVGAWGDYILPPGGRYYTWDDQFDVITNNSDDTAVIANPIVSNASLFGVNVYQVVDYLELDYQFSDDAGLPITVGGNVQFLYETAHMVTINRGVFTVSA